MGRASKSRVVALGIACSLSLLASEAIAQTPSEIETARSICGQYGFAPGTENFALCVMRTVEAWQRIDQAEQRRLEAEQRRLEAEQRRLEAEQRRREVEQRRREAEQSRIEALHQAYCDRTALGDFADATSEALSQTEPYFLKTGRPRTVGEVYRELRLSRGCPP